MEQISPVSTTGASPLELEIAFKQAHLSNYKVLTWSAGQLTAVDIWTTSGMTTQLFSKVFSYTGDRLDQTVLTRTSDGATLTRVFSYDVGGNLVTVDSTGV